MSRLRREPVLEAALIEEMERLGGTATTHDLRRVRDAVAPEMELHQDLSFFLIGMFQDGGVDTPFRKATPRGEENARRAWIRSHRPDQPDRSNQVWRLLAGTAGRKDVG